MAFIGRERKKYTGIYAGYVVGAQSCPHGLILTPADRIEYTVAGGREKGVIDHRSPFRKRPYGGPSILTPKIICVARPSLPAGRLMYRGQRERGEHPYRRAVLRSSHVLAGTI